MIEYRTGDILTADVEALVNTVNCVGVMGRGVALKFKDAFPANFKAYATACARQEVQPGRMFVFETDQLGNPKYIVNFPTKRHWRGKSRIQDIEAGLKALREEIEKRGIRSIALPPLGSGLGGLEWPEVRPLIEASLRDLDRVRVLVFEPRGSVELAERTDRRGVEPRMTAGRAALVGLICKYLDGLMDPFVTLLEVHKLMYFMQEAGEPLRLRFKQAPYGPYAENLRHVLRDIEGKLIAGFEDGGEWPDRELALMPGAAEAAGSFLVECPATKKRFERVAALVDGFETPFGLELLSTVHWVATRDTPSSAEEMADAVYAWADHKRQFSLPQIQLAFDVLAERGWLRAPGQVLGS